MAVQSVLEGLNIDYSQIELGKVKLTTPITQQQRIELDLSLRVYELELMDDKRRIMVEQIKTLIIQLFHSSNVDLQLKFSEYLSKELSYDYTYLSNVFSELEGTTIERFFIVNRVERVKELLVYEQMNITEISHQLNYSSVSHLCLQFKKVTGHTPLLFKKLLAPEDFVWRKCE